MRSNNEVRAREVWLDEKNKRRLKQLPHKNQNGNGELNLSCAKGSDVYVNEKNRFARAPPSECGYSV